jgi:F1F0 ATPase subunit 2
MSDGAWVAVSLAVGVALGLVHYGGLWWTTRRALAARQPALVLFGSFFARMVVVMAGVYGVMIGFGQSEPRWERAVAAIAGMLVARSLLVRRLGRATDKRGN